MDDEYVLVFSSFPTSELARQAAAELVERRLAACAQVSGPVTSIFRWQGKVETTDEWTCSFKTARSRCDAIGSALTALHPYDTPEVVVVPIAGGAAKYFRWIDESLNDSR